ncbi:MAG: TetR/AcrR family transcriptional regulator C-terminal domain-containing protein [Actinobacteria bacterium]|nr:TetR/AcrR family transcriptional regulator C-terminal domain-containing protein [Actinomycetota bacterium]
MAKGISRQRIVQAALELLDEEGLEGVTARALAGRLGVRAPALYWHVASKQEILDEMATEVRRRMAFTLAAQPEPAGWREGLAAYARVIRAEYLLHRDGARTFSGARVTDPEVLRAQQLWMERWTRSGLELAHAATAVQLVTALVVGFVIEEQSIASTDRYLLTASDPAIAAEVPLVTAAGQHLVSDADQRFEDYLDVVLTGIAARVDAALPAD